VHSHAHALTLTLTHTHTHTHTLPGDYAVLGADCIDDKPQVLSLSLSRSLFLNMSDTSLSRRLYGQHSPDLAPSLSLSSLCPSLTPSRNLSPPWRQPRGKSMVSLANSQTNATRIGRLAQPLPLGCLQGGDSRPPLGGVRGCRWAGFWGVT